MTDVESRDEALNEARTATPVGEEVVRLLVEAVEDYAIFLLSPDGTS